MVVFRSSSIQARSDPKGTGFRSRLVVTSVTKIRKSWEEHKWQYFQTTDNDDMYIRRSIAYKQYQKQA